MTLDASLLRRATLVNLERLARSLGVEVSDHEQHPRTGKRRWPIVLIERLLAALKRDEMLARVARYEERKKVA